MVPGTTGIWTTIVNGICTGICCSHVIIFVFYCLVLKKRKVETRYKQLNCKSRQTQSLPDTEKYVYQMFNSTNVCYIINFIPCWFYCCLVPGTRYQPGICWLARYKSMHGLFNIHMHWSYIFLPYRACSLLNDFAYLGHVVLFLSYTLS